MKKYLLHPKMNSFETVAVGDHRQLIARFLGVLNVSTKLGESGNTGRPPFTESPKLFWSPEKSVAGSLSVFAGGAVLTALILFIYVSLGVFGAPFSMYIIPILWVALGSMLIESLPFKDVDNITLTVVSALIGHLVF